MKSFLRTVRKRPPVIVTFVVKFPRHTFQSYTGLVSASETKEPKRNLVRFVPGLTSYIHLQAAMTCMTCRGSTGAASYTIHTYLPHLPLSTLAVKESEVFS